MTLSRDRARPPWFRRGPARRELVDLTVRLGAVVLPNPIVAASGTFGHGDELARLCDPSRLGAVTTKSQAPFAWEGNAPPRLHPAPNGMLNAVGLQGHGIEHWIEHDLPGLVARGARVIASVWGRTVEDFAEAARMLHPAVDRIVAVEVNASCPNLQGGHRIFAHDATMTADVVGAVVGEDLPLPILAKLSPDVTALPEIAGAALGAGASGLTVGNTVRGLLIDTETRRAVLGAGPGGLSGPAIRPIALRAVAEVASAFPGVTIVGTGGVQTGRDAVAMLLAGATAIGVGTATFAEPRATLRILDELVDWCAGHGVTRVTELVGARR